MKYDVDTDVEQLQRPLALSAQRLAERLGVSLRHVRRMDAAGLLPKPVRLGRSVRWSVEEVHAWMAAGAPDRRRWEQSKQRRDRRDDRGR